MQRICIAVLLIVLSLNGNAYGRAATEAEDIPTAVVKIRSIVPKEASSASSLGTEREGNGVVIDAEGTVLTIGYLVREASAIEVTGPGGESVSATLIGYDHSTGFGLLRTEKLLNVKPIKLGQSVTVKEGDPILVVGYGGRQEVLAAQVISRKEFAGYWEYLLEEAIYTAPVFANFSGAALINAKGQLVGIGSLFTQLLIPGYGSLPCNVFVPIDLINPILEDLKKEGRSLKPPRPWLGINAQEAHGRIFITRVTAKGPAEQAGLRPGDIVLTVDGKEVNDLADFYRKIWAVGAAGVEVPLGILQGIKLRDIKVHSADRNQPLKPKRGKGIEL